MRLNIKILVMFIFLIIIVIFSIIIVFIPGFKTKMYNVNNAEVEVYMQIRKAVSVKYGEWESVPHLADNYSYYIGIDKDRTLYVRFGDGVPILEYITRWDDETNKPYYNGYEDLIPNPKTEVTYKLSRFKYNKIVGNLNNISNLYEGSKELDEIEVIGMSANYYKYYRYNGKYYNIIKAGSQNKEVVSLYDKIEKMILPYIGIEGYPDNIESQ